MPKIGLVFRDQVLDRLKDATYGFNTVLAAVAPDYGLAPFEINWDPATSKNFVLGMIEPAEIQDAKPLRYPLVTLFTGNGVNKKLHKPAEFDGPVDVGIDFHFSWKAAAALGDFDAMSHMVEDAMIRVFNREPNWFSGQVAYDGDIGWEKKPVKFGGENWFQLVRYYLIAEVWD